VGPTALALVRGDAAAAAKVLSDTARALRGPLAFKGGVLDGVSLSSAEVETIAKLPSRDVLNAMLVGTIAAPLTGLARTLNALIQGLASQLGQIRDQGLVTGAALPRRPQLHLRPNDNELASEAPAAAEEATEAATEAPEPEAETAQEATDESEPEAPAEAEAEAAPEATDASEPEAPAEAEPEATEPEPAAEVETEAAPEAEPLNRD